MAEVCKNVNVCAMVDVVICSIAPCPVGNNLVGCSMTSLMETGNLICLHKH